MCKRRDVERTCDWDTTESKAGLDVQYIFHEMGWGEYDGIGDETILVSFHRSDHGRLRCGALVMMDYTNATKKLDRADVGRRDLRSCT